MSQKVIKIFFSYAREDQGLCDRIINHLRPRERRGIVELWHDRTIAPGQAWEQLIERKLDSADIVLLLISANFLGSHYCYDIEMPKALERHDANQAKVIPISLSSVDWDDLPFSRLNALPANRQPVDLWDSEDEALTDVAKGVKKVIDELIDERARKNVKEVLSQLFDDPDSNLRPYISQIQRLFEAKPVSGTHKYSLATYECIVEVFVQMNHEIQSGKAVQQAWLEAEAGRYFQAPRTDSTEGKKAERNVCAILRNFRQSDEASFSPLQQPIDVHIVLLAMNQAEAEELDSLEVFETSPQRLRDNFVCLKEKLDEELPGWQAHYQAVPELWQPFGVDRANDSIESLLKTTLSAVKDELEKQYNQTISLSRVYQDIRTLHQAGNQQILDELRSNECVIIVDAISLYHPAIFRSFQRSLLDIYHNTLVVTYAPSYPLLEMMREMTVALEFRISEMGFLRRQYNSGVGDQYMSCLDTHEKERFKAWLGWGLYKSIESKSFDPKASSQRLRERDIRFYTNNFD